MRSHVGLPFSLLATTLLPALAPAQTLPDAWDRDVDWVAPPDSAHGTTQGNPAPDSEGNRVWNYEFTTTGGRLGAPDPWYEESMSPLTWDKAWFGGDGKWSVSNDFGAVVGEAGLTHVGQWYEYRPMVRWENVTGKTFEVEPLGSLQLGWSGNFGMAEPVDVDVVLAHRDGGTGTVTVLFSQTVPKPTQDDTIETLVLPLDLDPVVLAPGDELLLSLLAFDSFVNGRWVNLVDRNLCWLRRSVGSRYCGPAVVNSSTFTGMIAATGSTAVADGDLTLKAQQLPLDEFGMFLAAPSSGFVQNPGGSDGNLCLGGGIGRFNGPGELFNTGDFPSTSLDLDLNAIPTPSGDVAVQPGETWHFQCWFRDGASSNFTDGIAITFT